MHHAKTELMRRLLDAIHDGVQLDLSVVDTNSLRACVFDLDGPLLAVAFAWLYDQGDVAGARTVSIDVLRQTDDPAVVAEAVSCLIRVGVPGRSDRRALWDTLVGRIEDRSLPYGVRSHALRGVLFLAESERALLRRLQGLLLDLDTADDVHFLRHAAKVLGVLLAHEPDDESRRLLASFAAIPEIRDEACLELGIDDLRSALDSSDARDAESKFKSALTWFEASSAAGEERPDAELYRQSLEVLLRFQTGDDNDLDRRCAELSRAAFQHAAHVPCDHRPDEGTWLGLAVQERIHWALMSSRLNALDRTLRKPAWLQAAAVIEEELLAAYTASRTLLLRDAQGGTEALIRPRISGAVQRERMYFACLDQWINENAGSQLLPDATALRLEVARAQERIATRCPQDAATEPQQIAAALERGGVPAAHHTGIVQEIVANVSAFAAASASPFLEELLVRVRTALLSNSDYARRSDAQVFFDIIVYHALLYVISRHEFGTGTQPRVAYLFERDEAKLPLEKVLQQDYVDFLKGTPLASICEAEARDHGGGRVDVLFTWQALQTVAELKRIIDRDLTLTQLAETFGSQAVAYQTTNVSFAILMVLDLFDRDGIQHHIREQVSVEYSTPAGGTTTYALVVVRVQGRRKVPSDL